MLFLVSVVVLTLHSMLRGSLRLSCLQLRHHPASTITHLAPALRRHSQVPVAPASPEEAAFLENTLRSTQFTCIFLATKIADQVGTH